MKRQGLNHKGHKVTHENKKDYFLFKFMFSLWLFLVNLVSLVVKEVFI
jgi:hypothetical protein